jgi:hypothetical protein
MVEVAKVQTPSHAEKGVTKDSQGTWHERDAILPLASRAPHGSLRRHIRRSQRDQSNYREGAASENICPTDHVQTINISVVANMLTITDLHNEQEPLNTSNINGNVNAGWDLTANKVI